MLGSRIRTNVDRIFHAKTEFLGSSAGIGFNFRLRLTPPSNERSTDPQKGRRVLCDDIERRHGSGCDEIGSPRSILPAFSAGVDDLDVLDPAGVRRAGHEPALAAVALEQAHVTAGKRYGQWEARNARSAPDVDERARLLHNRELKRNERISEVIVSNSGRLADRGRSFRIRRQDLSQCDQFRARTRRQAVSLGQGSQHHPWMAFGGAFRTHGESRASRFFSRSM